jgi:subtilisin family serine protease
MTTEERERIVSQDYADLIINYSGDQSVLDPYRNDAINIINFFYAVVNVPVSRINDNTILTLGYSVMPLAYGLISQSSIEASGIIRLRSLPNFNLRGQGVLIGILDTGIEYTNPVFKYADNTTKIVSIWDQTIFSDNYPAQYNYGTEYLRDQINQALQSENPLSIVPSTDEIGHGTMLAGIAAGNEVPESGFYGVAPDAELVIVKLKQAKDYLRKFYIIPEDVPCYQTNDILFAYDYLVSVANKLNRPIAICFGIGTSQYSHDGRGKISSYLSLRAESSGLAIVIAAGNEGNARRHYYGTIDPDIKFDLVELSVGDKEAGFTMELWGSTGDLYSIDIQSPSGEYIPRIVPSLDETRLITFIFEPTVINIDYQLIESQSGEQLIMMRFHDPAPGIWRIKVYISGDLPGDFHIWLPMGEFITNNTFFVKSDPYTTILTLGNARVPITVTAYNTEDDSLYINSSRGYTSIGLIKPEIAAPGVNILSPGLNNTFVQVTGTSAAAAHTAGVAAMLLEWAIVKGIQPALNTIDLKIFMIRGARRNVNIKYPNRDWGYGILDVYNIFDILRIGENSV